MTVDTSLPLAKSYVYDQIRGSDVDQQKARNYSAADWGAAIDALKTQNTATGTDRAALAAAQEAAVLSYQHLLSAIQGGNIAPELKANTDAFVAEFSKLLTELGKNNPAAISGSQFMTALQALATGDEKFLENYKALMTAVDNAVPADKSTVDRMLEMMLLQILTQHELYETARAAEANAVTIQVESLESEAKKDIDAANKRHGAAVAQATTQIATGAAQAAMGGATAVYAAKASVAEAGYKANHAQIAAAEAQGEAAPAGFHALMEADKTALKSATLKQNIASEVGKAQATAATGIAGLAAAGQELGAGKDAAEGKINSMKATRSAQQAKDWRELGESVLQNVGQLLSEGKTAFSANLQAMSATTGGV